MTVRPPADGAAFPLHRLTAADAAAYRDLRLQGLHDHPEAFGASWADEAARPLPWFADRLDRNAVFGADGADGGLAGVAGLVIPESPKLRHKGTLWGMFVRPEAQGAGLGRVLVAGVLAHAGTVVEEVQLTVGACNEAAVRLYSGAGFRTYGRELRALKLDGRYYDSLLMARPVGEMAGQQITPVTA